MAITITLPVVGSSQNTWGTILNQTITDIAEAVNGNATKVQPNLDNLVIDSVTVTASPYELNKLDGFTGNKDDLNLLDGAQAETTVNNKAMVYGPNGGISLGSGWIVEQNGNDLDFYAGGTRRMKLYANGDLAVEGNVTAYASL